MNGSRDLRLGQLLSEPPGVPRLTGVHVAYLIQTLQSGLTGIICCVFVTLAAKVYLGSSCDCDIGLYMMLKISHPSVTVRRTAPILNSVVQLAGGAPSLVGSAPIFFLRFFPMVTCSTWSCRALLRKWPEFSVISIQQKWVCYTREWIISQPATLLSATYLFFLSARSLSLITSLIKERQQSPSPNSLQNPMLARVSFGEHLGKTVWTGYILVTNSSPSTFFRLLSEATPPSSIRTRNTWSALGSHHRQCNPNLSNAAFCHTVTCHRAAAITFLLLFLVAQTKIRQHLTS